MVRIGLLGAGRWGKVYIKTIAALERRCRLTHLATSNPDNASLVPHPIEVRADWRDVVRAPCDLIIIATPPARHPEMLQACLAAGKPCIVEKPLCMDLPTAETLRDAVSKSGVPVVVDHTQLFNPAYITLKRLVRDRKEQLLGMTYNSASFGPFREDVSPLWDWGPHGVSLALDLWCRSPDRIEATASGARITLRLTFDVVASLEFAWREPRKQRQTLVRTHQHTYLFDDLAAHKLTQDGSPVPLSSPLLPMEYLMTTVLDGLAGGDRSMFGLDLAVNVTRVLATCEQTLK